MKIEGLVTDVTAVGSPERANNNVFGDDYECFFRPIQAAIVVRPLFDVRIPS